MGCGKSSVYPVPDGACDEEPNAEGYDPRWDRYRFRSESSQGSDGSSDDEQGTGWVNWRIRMARCRVCIAPCLVKYKHKRYQFRELDLCPVPVTLADSDDEKDKRKKNKSSDKKEAPNNNAEDGAPRAAGSLLDKVEREKLKKWMQTIADGEVEAHLRSLNDYGRDGYDHASFSASRSRASIHTTYTQDEADLVRTTSHSEPVRLTDEHTILRLQQHLDKQKIRNKMIKRQEERNEAGGQQAKQRGSGLIRPEESAMLGGVPMVVSRDASPTTETAPHFTSVHTSPRQPRGPRLSGGVQEGVPSPPKSVENADGGVDG